MPVEAGEPRPNEYRWYHKLSGLLFTILCFEVGLFLLVFPWMRHWTENYLAWLSPDWRAVWLNPYFRGAISGVGVLNLYISFIEVFRLRRFASL